MDGRLHYKPHIKSTRQNIPLSDTSSHAINDHRSWPIAEIKRIAKKVNE
ncbi:MAG: hypothetical protein ACKPKO_31880 [Candidatus Fonsibacter sp.]